MDQSLVDYFEQTNPALADLFRDLYGRTVYYVPNPGNGGDCLIAAAAYQLFRHYKISIELLHSPDEVKKLSGEFVFLAGGGNLVPMYQGVATMFRALIGRNNRVVLLPHSVRGNEELLALMEPGTLLFCRELASLAHVTQHVTAATVHLGHDLALYLDQEELHATPGLQEAAEPEFVERLMDKAKLTKAAIEGKRMSCIRGGVESTFRPKGPNYDISIVFQTGIIPGRAEAGSWMMLEFTRLAAHITTNRLHVGVASALTGTPTTLYDNSYGKVSGIYSHSMRERYPHVQFLEGDGPA